MENELNRQSLVTEATTLNNQFNRGLQLIGERAAQEAREFQDQNPQFKTVPPEWAGYFAKLLATQVVAD